MMGPMLIESPTNPRIRAALALRERRERDRTGLTLVDGARESRRAVEAGVRIEAAFACESRIRSDDARAAIEALAARRIPVHATSERAFERLAFGDRDDGIVLVIDAPGIALADLRLPADPLVLVTEDVEKPGNLGAVIRSADGAGADAVLAAGGTDLANPNVIRASAGTIFSIAVAADSPAAVADRLRASGVRIVATRVDAAVPYTDADLRGPVAIVVGSEALGLSDAWSGDDIEAVRIPMLGVADSLNVAATAAILLYEARRQRGTPLPRRG